MPRTYRNNRIASLPTLPSYEQGDNPNNRIQRNRKPRKPSIVEIFLPQHLASTPQTIKPSSSFNGDYRTLLTSKERIKIAKKRLIEIINENEDCEDEKILININKYC